ncbi:hypothetical protein FBEOM_1242 [Fusarium beomiforme]|uniref:Uncharacterized protein n=1 Tax=Fusarium beomiforme TaxID=44412 RepID=A0A9P5AU75_9HYPO|nr:hypothetical protein FBEOM_1242 [Fusarium beomiforme]
MTLHIIPTSLFIPLESVRLGRFISNLEQPHQSYHDSPSCEPPKQFVSFRYDYTGLHQNASDSGFGSALTSLISGAFSKRARFKVRIAAEQIKTYNLDNSTAWFEAATRVPATRSWIERAIDRGDLIYMIVGFHTVIDARISEECIQGQEAGGQVQVPVGLSLAAAGAIVPLGNLIDPVAGGNRRNLDSTKTQFMAPGEQVCALQYRQVSHKWLSRRAIDDLKLSTTPRWLSIERGRGWEEDEDEENEDEENEDEENEDEENEDEEDEGEDAIEVQLEDFNELDGEWERNELPGGETLLIRV